MASPSAVPAPPKLGVKVAFRMESQTPLLAEVDLIKDVSETTKWVCEKWGISEPENYVLYVSSEFDDESKQWIVTNDNKLNLVPGSILCITKSPFDELNSLIEKMNSSSDKSVMKEFLDHVLKYSKDLSYSEELIKKNGFSILSDVAFIQFEFTDPTVATALTGITNMFISHSLSVNAVSEKFLSNLQKLKANNDLPMETLATIYNLISVLLDLFPTLYEEISSFLNHVNLIEDFNKNNINLVFSVISCLISLFILTPPTDKMTLRNLVYKDEFRERFYQILASGVYQINNYKQGKIQLFEYIALFPIYLDINIKIDNTNSTTFMEKSKTIYYSVFKEEDKDVEPNYKKFGSQISNDPLIYFKRYPGKAAFRCLEYFSQKYPDRFSNFAIANQQVASSSSSCWSILAACSGIVKEMISYFRLNDELTSTHMLDTYHPIVFSDINAFEEIFCIIIEIFNKSWLDNNATTNDFTKVIMVVRQQMNIAFSQHPYTLDALKECLEKTDAVALMASVNIDKVGSRIQDSKYPTVKSLKEILKPQITDTVYKQRVAFITRGTVFNKSKSKKGSVFCCYYPKTASLHFADSDSPISPENMSNKIECGKIKSVVAAEAGAGNLTVKQAKKGFQYNITITTQNDEDVFEFYTKSFSDAEYWIDAINILIGQTINSDSFKEDFKSLMEFSLQLLLVDLEGVTLPEVVPPIPTLPPELELEE